MDLAFRFARVILNCFLHSYNVLVALSEAATLPFYFSL